MRRLLPLLALVAAALTGCGPAREEAPMVKRDSLAADQRAAIQAEETRYGIKVGP